jgi:GAF domain-containing protein
MSDPTTGAHSTESDSGAAALTLTPAAALTSALKPLDALHAFAELGRIKLADTDLHQVLGRVAELAKTAIPGAAEVSVTLVAGGAAQTAAFTGDIALALDEKQYETGFGPCLDAAKAKTVFVVREMATETRWPAFAVKATANGVNGSLSVGMPVEDTLSGALNMYATEVDAFGDDAVELAQTFASYAAVALANVNLYSTTAALAEQMAEAMLSRAVIEQAKGILIAQQRVTADEAFGILTRASQASNRKLRDIAQAIVVKAEPDPS